MEVLQTSALPLGYAAELTKTQKKAHKNFPTPTQFRVA
jgi:hypothetical protein